ncbi:DeoR family transcriptional regulator [Virgibacillus dokdonensis]|uniref:DeoR family transcriptional regulator n=1 Tax=Virgibacillus dokdonensis TaxID=302167 RepID=A0A3E0WUE2_9BACI|nr:DeoR/GlpR family DNA-binding transcription regulator [Virgibacillus dokdonensis]RFA35803.1 DeoR family transcriptional regulator [Virgibacillus dokdonensis]
MLTTDRYVKIMQLLEEKQSIKIQDAMEVTKASESTIRRDLTDLESQGKLVRIHGGATVLERKLQECSVKEKSTKNLQEKIKIAQVAANLVHEGDCLFLDAGTTTLQMIPYLKEKEVVVVTNGLSHVEALMKNGISTYLTGGYMKEKTGALVGVQAVQSIHHYRFDKCFLGANGFHVKLGYTTPDPEEAMVKKTAANHALQTYVLADQSKKSKISFAKVLDLQEATLITEELPQDEIKRFTKETTVKVAEQ